MISHQERSNASWLENKIVFSEHIVTDNENKHLHAR